MGEWINAAELPEKIDDVLVCAFWHEKWQVLIGWYAENVGGWVVMTGNEYRTDLVVSHWMPLPSVPEREVKL